jgi:prepilin-type N-terminal cleavage/methylation domain-containing protein
MGHKRQNGFTLIELTITILVIAVLSAGGAYIMTYLIQSAVYIPSKLNMDMLASDALTIMIDGDSQAKGLRFSRSVTDIQPYQITFINQDNQTINYQLNTGTNKLYRSINGNPAVLIPYYIPSSGISMSGKNGQLFLYYDGSEVITANPVNVRRIAVALIAMTGSGSFDQWQGKADLSSAVAVKRF